MQKPLIKEKTTEKLRTQILKIRTGSLVKIASERELAETLGVSRVSVRAAIKALTNEGLLIQIRGKGTYITPDIKLNSLHVLCSPDIKANDPFYNMFLVELTNMAVRHSINIFMKHPEHINNNSIEPFPLIVVGIIDDRIMERIQQAYKIIITLHDYPNFNNIIQIYYDDYKIGYKAAKTLTEHNHRNILLLAGPGKYPSALNRKEGFIDASKALGTNPTVITEKMNWAGGYKAAEYLLNNFSESTRPTGVFASNDWMAVGFIQRLKEGGLRVPEDLSVIGCDDIPLAKEYFPALTTFSLDMKYLVEELFSILSKTSITGGDIGKKVLLNPSLVYRESLRKI
ncbi:MAG: GntR family transcriptional regulator [Firmicutes bacterium]|nr:GntR family transcriptional regulator [Bacillota bacterium]